MLDKLYQMGLGGGMRSYAAYRLPNILSCWFWIFSSKNLTTKVFDSSLAKLLAARNLSKQSPLREIIPFEVDSGTLLDHRIW
jgi:hypothetical protein